MILESDILDEYDSVRIISGGVYFFQDEVATYTLNYWLKPSTLGDLIVVSRNKILDSLALTILRNSCSASLENKPIICEFYGMYEGFSHVLIVPPNYHGYLKGAASVNRDNLYLCVPIFRCEFSGFETEEEFRWLSLHNTATLDWAREAQPILRVYFDNPKTGSGSDKSGVYLRWSGLVREIDLLNGVRNGFIEIANWNGDVVEVVSQEPDKYILIKERKLEIPLSKTQLIDYLKSFAYS